MLGELKAILEAVENTTIAAQQIGLFWLANQLFSTVLAYTLGGLVVLGGYKLLSRVIAVAKTHTEENSFIKSLRQLISPHNAYGVLTGSEKTQIIEIVKLGMKRDDEKKQAS